MDEVRAKKQWSVWWVVGGLCLFIACLSFKPSEPYLSQYLICDYDSVEGQCNNYNDASSCSLQVNCIFDVQASSCVPRPCQAVAYDLCGNSDFPYCKQSGNQNCNDVKCYKDFSEDEVNNDIYPWSTYAYLPFLLLLGPFAEVFSYKFAILFGILGRVATRFLLLYGRSLMEMQLMQVSYSLGTAAEDVFSAYVYYVVGMNHYQAATSYIKAAALLACVVSGVLGDLLVVQWNISLRALMWISGVFVWTGFFVGLYVIRASNNSPDMDDVSEHSQAKVGQDAAPSLDRVYPPGKDTDAAHVSEVMFFKDSPFVHHRSHSKNHVKTSDDMNLLETPHISRNSDSLEKSAFVKKVFDGVDHSTTFSDKIRVFKLQLNYLHIALQSFAFSTMLIMWIVGNAVFSILYNYEVAIYEELQGSNDWNGSVLAIMLLAGSIGAMLPTWLHAKTSPLAGNREEDNPSLRLLSGGVTIPDSEAVVCIRLLIACLVGAASLLLFVGSWTLIRSISFLALFFACWQYVNAVVFTRMAMYLKLAQMHQLLRKKFVNDRMSEDSNSFNINFLQDYLDSASDEGDERSALTQVLQKAASSPSAFPRVNSKWSSEDDDAAASHDLVDPPYSFAIVTIIALNVVVQVVLQSVLFSWLGLDLKFACWIFVLVFCGMVSVYLLLSVFFFGTTALWKEFRWSVLQRVVA